MIMIGDFPLHANGREVSINRSRHGEGNNDDTTQKMTDFLGDGTCLAETSTNRVRFDKHLQHVSATRVSVCPPTK